MINALTRQFLENDFNLNIPLYNEDIIIIDNGQPIFKVSKYQKKSPSTAELFAPLRGKVKYYEDLTSPTIEE